MAARARLVSPSASLSGGWVLLFSAAAWTLLLLFGPMPLAFPLCLPSSSYLAGRVGAGLEAARQTGAVVSAMTGWALMVVAMAPPLAMPLIRHVSVRSFAQRRCRAVMEFTVGGIAPWLVAGVAAVPVLISVPMSGLGQSATASLAFAVAAAWQLTPAKCLALRRCHRTMPLAPRGIQADRDCLRYGVVYGGYCVASCWAMMLAAMLSAHAWLAMLYVQFIAMEERRPGRPSATATALALLAGSALNAMAVLLHS